MQLLTASVAPRGEGCALATRQEAGEPSPRTPVRDDLLLASKVNIMKLSAIEMAIVLAGLSGVAVAAAPTQTSEIKVLPRVTVSMAAADCARPRNASDHTCDVLNALVRADFTPRERRMVTTWREDHPDYLFDEIYQLHDRYETALQGYANSRKVTDAHTVVAR